MGERERLIKKAMIALLLVLIGVNRIFAQSGLCDPNTPYFEVDLQGQPNGTWVSDPPVARQGNCCGTTAPDRCIEFKITLDVKTVAINFAIASGALPPGALFYQINCGPMVPVGSPICVNGAGPHVLTFCKPGNNQNTYSVTAIAGPEGSPDVITSDGCTVTMTSSGLLESSITWTSIFPGTTGQYNNYLSCTAGCDSVTVTPQPGYPPYIDFVMSGQEIPGPCASPDRFYDTIRATFIPPIQNAIMPSPAKYCINQPGVQLTTQLNGGLPPYTFEWIGPGNTVISNSQNYFATTPGTYTFKVRDFTYPNCPERVTSVDVSVLPIPIVNAGPDVTVCPGNPDVILNGSVQNSLGGVWTGGTGTYNPDSTSLNAVYTPSASEIQSGLATLTLKSTGSDPCDFQTDKMYIRITDPLTVNINGPSIVCYGQTADLSAQVSGGTAPYTYSWSTGAVTSSIQDVLPGIYTVTVTDATANPCQETVSFQVNENPILNVTAPSDNIISCDTAVYISVSALGGSGVINYLWNTGATTSGILVNSGTYIVTAFDGQGCTARDTISLIASNSVLQASLSNPPIVCYGATTDLFASATGGFGGYTYSWSNGQTGAQITEDAGQYCVTAMDSMGCLNTACREIVQDSLLTITIPKPATICYNATTTATAIVSGGRAPYTYLWSTGETNSSITKGTGTYSLTVIDSNPFGCSATASVTIDQATEVLLSIGETPVSCFGGSNGSANVMVTGGTPGYEYQWSSGSTSNIASGLPAGNVSVQVTDLMGCVKNISITVTEPLDLVSNVTINDHVSCNGLSDASVTANPSGGVLPYTYFWTGSSDTTQTVSNLASGSHSVTITDKNGCNTTSVFSISQPEVLSLAASSINDVSCFNGSDGSASVTASGGTLPYSYVWVNPSTTGPVINNIPDGIYRANVTDANGCSSTYMVTINEPTELISFINGSTPVSCYGANDATASVFAEGGTPGYNYSWSPSTQSDSVATGLIPGDHVVTITDGNGCTTTSTISFIEPESLTASVSAVDVSCYNGNNGSADVVGSGGTLPYTYSWSSGGSSGSSANGFIAGNYSSVITDQHGCTIVTSFTINQPDQLTASVSTLNSSCEKPNGTAIATVNGGNGIYTYSWSNDQTSSTAVNLMAGPYSVDIVDQKGCTVSASAEVMNTSTGTASISSFQHVSCYGFSDGSAMSTMIAGTAPFTYSWSNGATTKDASNLSAGVYILTVTDSLGCIARALVRITEPLALTMDSSYEHVDCFGASTGSASVVIAGGTTPYTYAWSNGSSASSVSNIAMGIYNVSVTDQKGCTITETFNITEPAEMVLSTSSVSAICTNDNGTASVSPTGGVLPYTYTWTNGSTLQDASFVVSGDYTVVVTDQHGCSKSATVTVTRTEGGDAVIASTKHISCYGSNDGMIQVAMTGPATAPFTYSWSDGQVTQTATSLAPGGYSVLVTDDNGCTSVASDNITTPELLTVSASSENVKCFQGSDGSAVITAAGGTQPYTYQWSNGSSGSSISGLIAGSYTGTVIDANNCSASVVVVITQPTELISSINGSTPISCNGTNDATASVHVEGGTPGYNYSWSPSTQSDSIATGLIPGDHVVTITDGNGCTTTSTISFIEPGSLTATVSAVDVSCYNGSNGSAAVVGAGGTFPYSYSWSSGGSSGSSANGFIAGNYSSVITDQHGCTVVTSFTINQPELLTAYVSTLNSSCEKPNGTAIASVNGGNGIYTYSWSNGQTSSTAVNLMAGPYSVDIVDQKGCTVSASAEVMNTSTGTASIASYENVSCYGLSDGSAVSMMTAGTAPFTYSWSNGATTKDAVNLAAGIYSLTVTDALGCVSNTSVTITQPLALTLDSTYEHVDCFGASTGSASVVIAGGTTPYTYAWSNGSSASSVSNIAMGIYNVSVTDQKGCTITETFNITEPAEMVLSTSSVSAICTNDNGTASVSPTGGVLPYTYTWTNGSTLQDASFVVSGDYTVVVTDQHGCSKSATVTVTRTEGGDAVIASTKHISCYGSNDGMIQVAMTGPATAPFTYSWSDGQVTQTATSLAPGGYSVLVTDDNGCTSVASDNITTPEKLINTISKKRYFLL